LKRIIRKVGQWISGGARAGSAGESGLIVVPQGAAGSQPRDQLALLRRLSQFAGKEQIPVTALLQGEPLRKHPDGSEQDGVRVFYAAAHQVPAAVAKLVRQAGPRSGVTVVAGSREVAEQAAAAGAGVMRFSTLGKALDAIVGPAHQEPARPKAERPPPKPDTPEPEVREEDRAVLELIDPL
jgi:hypothetical protein